MGTSFPLFETGYKLFAVSREVVCGKRLSESLPRHNEAGLQVAVAADHAGYRLKKAMLDHLSGRGYRVIDLGTDSDDPVDYPDYATAVAREIIEERAERGILICGSGVGASVAANKFPGIRAFLCLDAYSARQGVEDDDANVLCLGARVVGEMLAFDLADHFLSARFKALPRHTRRLEKIAEIERSCGTLPPVG